MNTPAQLARHLRDVHFGGNWTSINLKKTLEDLTWEEATRSVHACNSIATLVYHVNYYITAVTKVLQGEVLNAKDEYSFLCPPINSPEDWDKLRNRVWEEAEVFAALIEKVPESRLCEDFTEARYGTWFRNLAGIIEHMHYHMGQMVILKKVMRAERSQSPS